MATRQPVKRLLARIEAIAPARPLAVVWLNYGEDQDEALARHLERRPDHRDARIRFVTWLPPGDPCGL